MKQYSDSTVTYSSSTIAYSGGIHQVISNAGGNWSSTSTWVSGIVPVSGDSISATASSGNLTIDTNLTSYSFAFFSLANYTGILTINAPNTVTFQHGVTHTMSGFVAVGTSSNGITLQSDSGGNQFTLSQASGINDVSYCSIRDSNATGGASWYAPFAQGNTSVSDNSGWIFTGVAPYTGNLSIQIKPQSSYYSMPWKYTGHLSIQIKPRSTYFQPNHFYAGSLSIQIYFFQRFPAVGSYQGLLYIKDILGSNAVITENIPVNDAVVGAGCSNCGTMLWDR